MADATFNFQHYVESPVAGFADFKHKKFFPQGITLQGSEYNNVSKYIPIQYNKLLQKILLTYTYTSLIEGEYRSY